MQRVTAHGTQPTQRQLNRGMFPDISGRQRPERPGLAGAEDIFMAYVPLNLTKVS